MIHEAINSAPAHHYFNFLLHWSAAYNHKLWQEKLVDSHLEDQHRVWMINILFIQCNANTRKTWNKYNQPFAPDSMIQNKESDAPIIYISRQVNIIITHDWHLASVPSYYGHLETPWSCLLAVWMTVQAAMTILGVHWSCLVDVRSTPGKLHSLGNDPQNIRDPSAWCPCHLTHRRTLPLEHSIIYM